MSLPTSRLTKFVRLAAQHGVPVICQSRWPPPLPKRNGWCAIAARQVYRSSYTRTGGGSTPYGGLKQLLAENCIGTPFRARIDMISGFPVFANQPFLAELEQFILTDLGSHILDVARFLFGEAESVYCQTKRIHPAIKGEDVATVLMRMGGQGTTVLCEMAYAGTPLERERFPETFIFVEERRARSSWARTIGCG